MKDRSFSHMPDTQKEDALSDILLYIVINELADQKFGPPVSHHRRVLIRSGPFSVETASA